MFDRTEEMIAKARVMAEEFAKLKTPDFLKAFLRDTAISADMKRLEESLIEDERYLNLLINEYLHPFGQALSLAYAIGFMDAKQNAPSDLYRRKGEKPREAAPCELIKPGEM